jgi:hypothetical protein
MSRSNQIGCRNSESIITQESFDETDTLVKDNQGFCWAHKELRELLRRSRTHPMTRAPWSQITVIHGGHSIGIVDYYNTVVAPQMGETHVAIGEVVPQMRRQMADEAIMDMMAAERAQGADVHAHQQRQQQRQTREAVQALHLTSDESRLLLPFCGTVANIVSVARNSNGQIHHATQPAVVCRNSVRMWFREGVIHRGGHPAVMGERGLQVWINNGAIHRDGDNPAVSGPKGVYYYKNGRLHRGLDRPAVIKPDGSQAWFRFDKLHRDGGKPAVIKVNGSQEMWVNGIRRR